MTKTRAALLVGVLFAAFVGMGLRTSAPTIVATTCTNQLVRSIAAFTGAATCSAVATADITDANVTNAKLANMANATLKCRTTAGTGVPEDCTGAQAATIAGVTTNGTAAVGQLPGTTTNDAAAAGKVGEYNVSDVVIGLAVLLTNNIPANLTSLTLQPGDYVVFCTLIFQDTGTTVTSYVIGGMSTTTAVIGLARGQVTAYSYSTAGVANTLLNNIAMTAGPYHVQVATSTTQQVFCVGQSGFSVSTMAIYGGMSAQRIR